jgi:capsid protein
MREKPQLSFKDRLKVAGRVGLWAVTGQWEGHERDRYRNRPEPRRVSQDADLNFGVREDLCAEARALAQTVPIVERILRQFANYVVGDCKARWMTTDKEWNDRAQKQFADWSNLCDWRQVHGLKSLMRLAVASEPRDGDFFLNEIEDDGFYFLECVEGDRVTNSRGSGVNFDEPNLTGGVKTGSRGEPLAYRVCDRQKAYGVEVGVYVNPRDIPSAQMIHYFDTLRADAYRGVTSFKTVLNHIRDFKETIKAEKTAQKAASRLALIVKNAIGGTIAIPGAPSIFATGNETSDAGTEFKTEEVSDGVIRYMFNGDDVQAFMSNRPSDGWFNLTLLLIRDISIGLDLPFEFVWNMSGLQGTATRMVSKQAERTFSSKQDILERRVLNRIGMRWAMMEMAEGRLPFNPEFAEFYFPRPAHPSVDAGQDSKSDVEELNAGVTTEDDIAAKSGKIGGQTRLKRYHEAQEKLTYAAQLMDEFKERKVTIQDALALMGRANAATAGNTAQQSEPKEAVAA